jgi:hypothetical protein
MIGGVSPETCWASDKYGMIRFWYIVASCWIFLYEQKLYCYQTQKCNKLEFQKERKKKTLQFV